MSKALKEDSLSFKLYKTFLQHDYKSDKKITVMIVKLKELFYKIQ